MKHRNGHQWTNFPFVDDFPGTFLKPPYWYHIDIHLQYILYIWYIWYIIYIYVISIWFRDFPMFDTAKYARDAFGQVIFVQVCDFAQMCSVLPPTTIVQMLDKAMIWSHGFGKPWKSTMILIQMPVFGKKIWWTQLLSCKICLFLEYWAIYIVHRYALYLLLAVPQCWCGQSIISHMVYNDAVDTYRGSYNWGVPPKSSVLIAYSILKHPAIGVPAILETAWRVPTSQVFQELDRLSDLLKVHKAAMDMFPNFLQFGGTSYHIKSLYPRSHRFWSWCSWDSYVMRWLNRSVQTPRSAHKRRRPSFVELHAAW